MPTRQKMKFSKYWLYRLEEDRRDYELGMQALQEGGPTYSLDEVVQHLGMDKYHLKFGTRRLQKKHKLEINATQK